MSYLIPILDSGHGGMIGGQYQTKGKRSPDWDKGILYEGMFNRWVINRLIEKLDRNKIPYYHVSPELTDTPLSKRVARANDIYKYNKKAYVLSIHANAGNGTGIEGFTSEGQTNSDKIAEVFLELMQNQGEKYQLKLRKDTSDGDLDKESQFLILRKTQCPAFLFECGFMDNKEDYKDLWSEWYLEFLVDTLYTAIFKLYNFDYGI